MTGHELAALLAGCLHTPDLGCVTELDPARPTTIWIYAGNSIHRIDVHAVANNRPEKVAADAN